jgi:hypothetical protein
MTTKEKAKELVDKFYPRATSYSLDGKNQNENAKQCALIAVDEILSSNPHSNPLNTNVESTMEYWQEVKQEIINL